MAIGVNDALGFFELDDDAKIFELSLEFRRTHAVPRPKNCCLTNKTLILCNLFDTLAVDSRSHDFVNVLATVKCLH